MLPCGPLNYREEGFAILYHSTNLLWFVSKLDHAISQIKLIVDIGIVKVTSTILKILLCFLIGFRSLFRSTGPGNNIYFRQLWYILIRSFHWKHGIFVSICFFFFLGKRTYL